MRVKRALLSVYDKQGLADFAVGLSLLGVELVSSGGTARHLEEAGLKVTRVEDVTGSPELLDGRVKTLHPRIHAGILARRRNQADVSRLAEMDIDMLDMVVVNLYPFAETVANPECTTEEALENIDIGGPALLRAAAKNYPDVLAVCSPWRYQQVLQWLEEGGNVSASDRRELALESFAHTAAYDQEIAAWLGGDREELPTWLSVALQRKQMLRYGENPQQKAALYLLPGSGKTLAASEPLQGKELSYNNLNDAAAAWELVSELEEPAAVAVKHAVPCGVGLAESVAAAFVKAREADPVSIFGGIIAFNRTVDEETAGLLSKLFLEVILAPDYTSEAREVLAEKKNLRLLACQGGRGCKLNARTIPGGVLVQESDEASTGNWQTVTDARPDVNMQQSSWLAWIVAKHAKSNAIVVAREGMTVGVGSGCTSRIEAARRALTAAGERARGAVLASDGFIPFPDVVEAAAAAGVSTIIQPGGSRGDDEIISAANRLGLAMVFTGTRHFRH